MVPARPYLARPTTPDRGSARRAGVDEAPLFSDADLDRARARRAARGGCRRRCVGPHDLAALSPDAAADSSDLAAAVADRGPQAG